jgi:hypothetical protein
MAERFLNVDLQVSQLMNFTSMEAPVGFEK